MRGQVQVPEVSKKLANFLQVKESTIAPGVAPDLFPVIVVGDLTKESIEDTSIERPLIDSIVLTSIAADIAVVWHLGNPASSGTVVIVDHIVVGGTVQARWDIVLTTNLIPVGSTLGTPKPRHTGMNNVTAIDGKSAVQGQWGAKSNAIAGGGNFSSRYVAAYSNYDIMTEPMILTPGFALRVQRAGGIAMEQQATFIWRERRLTP
jgi:hypothetical protein